MKLNDLIYGKFLERKNRFLWFWDFNWKEILFHVADSWRLEELLFQGNDIICFKRKNPWKTQYSLFAVRGVDWDFILINSQFHPQLVCEYLDNEKISYKKEVQKWDSRYDFLIWEKWIEVKWCSLKIWDYWVFPDAPTIRWSKHIKWLIEVIKDWWEAEVWFLLTNHVKRFKPNEKTDPNFSRVFYDFLDIWWAVRFFNVNMDLESEECKFWIDKVDIFIEK